MRLNTGLLALAGTLILVGPAHAADYTVSRTDDPVGATCAGAADTQCTLRSALASAVSAGGEQTITLTATEPYRLDQGQLALTQPGLSNIRVVGRGAPSTTITALGASRAFDLRRVDVFPRMTLRDLAIVGTRAPAGEDGGAIRSEQVDLALDGVEVRASHDDGPDGAAVLMISGENGVSSSAIVDSTAGAGLSARGAAVGIYQSTLSGNAGAGLVSDAPVVDLVASTITGNGSGIRNVAAVGSVRVQRTIVDQGASGCTGGLDDQGANLDSGSSCFGVAAGSAVDTPAGLAGRRLTFLGGPPVHAPAPGSAAIDGVAADGCGTDTSDNRGATGARPRDGDGDGVARCDIGAVEYQPPRVLAGGIGSALQQEVRFEATIANGDAPAVVRVEYGPTPGYGTVSDPVQAGFSSAEGDAAVTVAGLRPGTTYHYRLLLSDGATTFSRTPDMTVRTADAPPADGQAPSGGSTTTVQRPHGDPPAAPPLVTTVAKLGKLSLETVARKGFPARVTCSAACRIDARLTTTRKLGKRLKVKRRRLARVASTGAAGKPKTVRLKLSRKLVERVRRAKVKSLTLTVTTTPVAGGAPVTTTRKVTLTR